MITEKQKELVLQLIGMTSVFFNTFRNYDGLNSGSKLYYLEQAIKQESSIFLNTLDKFHFQLKNDEKTAQIILSGLKLINDLYFNNPIVGTYRKALDMYFSSLGEVNPQEFKVFIASVIRYNCGLLSYGTKKVVLQKQKDQRESEEVERGIDSSWRNQLSCPPAPLMFATLSNSDVTTFFSPKPKYSYATTLNDFNNLPLSVTLLAKEKADGRRQYTSAELVAVLRAMEEELNEDAESRTIGQGPC